MYIRAYSSYFCQTHLNAILQCFPSLEKVKFCFSGESDMTRCYFIAPAELELENWSVVRYLNLIWTFFFYILNLLG